MDLSNIEFIQKNEPATEKEIQLAESQIHGLLPDIYKDFLHLTNGMVLNLCVLKCMNLLDNFNLCLRMMCSIVAFARTITNSCFLENSRILIFIFPVDRRTIQIYTSKSFICRYRLRLITDRLQYIFRKFIWIIHLLSQSVSSPYSSEKSHSKV